MDVRERVRKLLRERGATAAARDMQMARETLLAVGADAPVLEATLALAAQRLEKVGAGRP